MDAQDEDLPSRDAVPVKNCCSLETENRIKNEVRRKELNEAETFETLQLQFLWRPTGFYYLLSGSAFELPICYVLTNLTDVDYMRIYPNFHAIPRHVKLPDNSAMQFFLIDTQRSFVGFCRLQYHNENRFYARSRTGFHGPARKVLLSDWHNLASIFSDIMPNLVDLHEVTLDQVDAVFCPYWPSEASDWMTRISVSGWPDKNLRDHIMRGGCHLVAKSHHREPDNDTQWRYSFSQAEIILVNSWSDVQKYIYHILRVIKGRITKKCNTPEKSIFNNYFFKTLMLWASEKKPVKFWNKESIDSSIAELLGQAIECLIDRECPHYFIPQVNILDEALESDMSNEISSIEEHIRCEIQNIVCHFPKCDQETSFQFELSKNFVVHHKIRANAAFVINPLSLSFERYFDNELENDPLCRKDVEILLNVLFKNLELRSSKSVTRRIDYEKTVVDCFRFCLEENSSNLVGAIINSTDSFHTASNKLFNVGRCIAHASPLSGCLLPSVSSKKPADKLQITPLEAKANAITKGKSFFSDILLSLISAKISKLYRKPSYLISRAYCANYYYTYQKSYDTALNLCKETLGSIENFQNCSATKTRMYEDIFPVIFSSYWMPLFDENIQVVFALLILTIVVSYTEGVPLTSLLLIPPSPKNVPRSYSVRLDFVIRQAPFSRGKVQRRYIVQQLISSVVVQLSAVEFMRYIGLQCRKHLSLGKDSLFEMKARQQRPNRRRLVHHSDVLLAAAASFQIPSQ